jgi:molybdopterin molybdotransferase
MVRHMMGFPLLHRPVRRAMLDGAYAKGADAGRTLFVRVRLREQDGTLHAVLTGPQGSGILTSMAEAEALAIIPEEVSTVEAGSLVEVQLTDLPEDH